MQLIKSPINLENFKFDDFFSNYKNEYCYKYSERLYDAFIKAFSFLPIAAIINKDTFCIHGGLSPKLDQVDKINILIKRPINDFDENSLLSDLVWSDPLYCPNLPFVTNTRGSGFLFNIEAVNTFLKKNLIKRIIRAHECVENGILKNFGDKLMTVFSASSYDKNIINNSGIIQLFEKDSKFKTITFLPLPRLQKSEAIYYKVQSLNMNDDNNNHQCFSFLHPKLFSRQYDSRVKQCKVSSENLSLIHSNQGKLVHLTRPKFTTNRRQSCNCIFDKPSLLSSSPLNSDNDDKCDKIKIRNHSQHLPASLFSFSDSNVLSDE